MAGKTLGQTLRAAREETGESLREIARRVGITPSYLSDIELDRRVPAEYVLTLMAVELEIDPAELQLLTGHLTLMAQMVLKQHPALRKVVELVAAEGWPEPRIEKLLLKVRMGKV